MADSADLLRSRLDVVFLVDDPESVRPDLRARLDVRPASERHDPSIDVVIYHLANNPHHEFVYRAALEGPAGLCEVHDASLHHLVNYLYEQDGDAAAYQAAGYESHGADGRDAVNMRRAFSRGALELFLYDLLGHVLRRHAGAIVHSEYAASLIDLGAPEIPTWLARLHAPEIPPHATKAEAGLRTDRFVIGAFGYIAAPKRPLLLVDAFRRSIERGMNGHLVFVGKDDTRGELKAAVDAADIADRVTITGFVGSDQFHTMLTAIDVAVSLRAPHAGETSATLAYALAAGRPTVVQDIGSWSEIPHDVVVHVPVGDDEAGGLAEAFTSLAADPERCRAISRAAERFAREELTPDRYCDAIVAAVDACLTDGAVAVPPSPLPTTRELRTRRQANAWRAVLDELPIRRLFVLPIDCPAWVTAELTWSGHHVMSPSMLPMVSAGTIDVVLAPAAPPGPERRASLAAINRFLAHTGRVVLTTTEHGTGGRALLADLDVAGFSVRSPRFDDPPTDLWPPPRDASPPRADHVTGRKAGLPNTA